MRAGDVVQVDFGVPQGSEPGFVRPAIVVTADTVLEGRPRTIHVVPVTSNIRRDMPTDVLLDEADLAQPSAAQVHLCTVVSTTRLSEDEAGSETNVGPARLSQIRAILSDLLDIP